MMEPYAVLAGRIRLELGDLERIAARAERAMAASDSGAANQDLYLDSVALNLHDFYAGLERVFHRIAALVDGSVPGGSGWHRELLRQMCGPGHCSAGSPYCASLL